MVKAESPLGRGKGRQALGWAVEQGTKTHPGAARHPSDGGDFQKSVHTAARPDVGGRKCRVGRVFSDAPSVYASAKRATGGAFKKGTLRRGPTENENGRISCPPGKGNAAHSGGKANPCAPRPMPLRRPPLRRRGFRGSLLFRFAARHSTKQRPPLGKGGLQGVVSTIIPLRKTHLTH